MGFRRVFVPGPGVVLSIEAEKVAVASGGGEADAAASFTRLSLCIPTKSNCRPMFSSQVVAWHQ
jgi:hypothetical protein